MRSSEVTIKQLHKDRPRSLFAVRSIRLMLLLILASWIFGGFLPADILSTQSVDNAQRLWEDMRPYPLQKEGGDLGEFFQWARVLWSDRGQEAILITLSISVLAMVLAGFAGVLLSIPAARNLMQANPFIKDGKKSAWWQHLSYGGVVYATRLTLIFLRAIPEYVWAFLLLGMYGPTAWPMVLALALHNAGILGKLNAEVLENSDPGAASAWRSAGCSRSIVVLGALVPQVLSRLLMFFFYRWETCVREATVLGMLGMASLGFWITDSRLLVISSNE